VIILAKKIKKPEKKTEVVEEEDSSLPFPSAPIVRVMRKNLDREKLIRRRVKQEMNRWLARMCENVSKEMNKTPYSYIDYGTFKEAIKVYTDLEEMQQEKDRIVASLQKIKLDCDSLIRDLNKKLDI